MHVLDRTAVHKTLTMTEEACQRHDETPHAEDLPGLFAAVDARIAEHLRQTVGLRERINFLQPFVNNRPQDAGVCYPFHMVHTTLPDVASASALRLVEFGRALFEYFTRRLRHACAHPENSQAAASILDSARMMLLDEAMLATLYAIVEETHAVRLPAHTPLLWERTQIPAAGDFPVSLIWDAATRTHLVGQNSRVELFDEDWTFRGVAPCEVELAASPYMIDHGPRLTLLEAGGARLIRQVDRASGALVREVDAHASVGRILPFPDGRLLASCTDDAGAQYLEILSDTLTVQSRIQPDLGRTAKPGEVTQAAVLDNECLLILANADECAHRLAVYSLTEQRLLRTRKFDTKNFRVYTLARHGDAIYFCGAHCVGVLDMELRMTAMEFLPRLWAGSLQRIVKDGVPYLYCMANMNNAILRWRLGEP